MSRLAPIPFPTLLRRMRDEVQHRWAIFDLPVRKWFQPSQAVDLSALHFGRKASTPLGPAAGPHTQLAQNIVLCWLAGSRIIELKTVQINDQLEIPRPCIHAPNIGLNVEWSQELAVEESIFEYAKAVYLIEILKATGGFGELDTSSGGDTIYDISVGYDLAGIQSEKVTGFLKIMGDAESVFETLREQLRSDLGEFRDLELPATISDCVTLSTFHGCPADEIESIALYLIRELGIDTIIKLNPTLLGYERVVQLLIEELGYDQLRLRREAFESDLKYDEGLSIFRRLWAATETEGSTIGAKFTNTLVVENDRTVFPTQSDPYMYLSGPPLHVLSMNLMQRFREDLGFEMPVSFSAGIDVKNFADAVACGMTPITTCTDLLKQGGYGRLPGYLKALGREMEKVKVDNREAFVLCAGGNALQAIEETFKILEPQGRAWQRNFEQFSETILKDPSAVPAVIREVASAHNFDPEHALVLATRVAGRLNGRQIVPLLKDNPRYHRSRNSKPPKNIDKQLALYDCINCDLCISACPNDAIFAYEVDKAAQETVCVTLANGMLEEQAGRGFLVEDPHQLALIEGACNECSNCEIYCPEQGAPFLLKEQLFLDETSFEAAASEGICRLSSGEVRARIAGRTFTVKIAASGETARVVGDDFTIEVDWNSLRIIAGRGTVAEFDTADLRRVKVAVEAILESNMPSYVS